MKQQLTTYSLSNYLFFFILLVISFATRSMVLTGAFLLYSTVLLILNSRQVFNEFKIHGVLLTPLLLIVLFMSFLNFFRNESVLYHLVISILTVGLSLLFAKDKLLYYKMSLFGLVFFQTLVIILAMRIGFAGFPWQTPLELIIPNSSANGITSYLIILQINLCIVEYLMKRKINLLFPLLTLVVAFMGYGRSSIVASFLIIILSIFTNIYFSQIEVKRIYFGIIILVSILLFVVFKDGILLFFESNTKLGAGFQDAQRELIINDYLKALNGWSIFVGADYDNTRIDYRYNGNPHITFIRAHHIFGLPYLLCVIGMILGGIFSQKGFINIVVVGGFFGIILLRALSEPILFPTFLDFFIFSLLILSLINSKKPLSTINLSN